MSRGSKDSGGRSLYDCKAHWGDVIVIYYKNWMNLVWFDSGNTIYTYYDIISLYWLQYSSV